jgi:dUTPase
MDVKYTLELFPTEGNWDLYLNAFQHTTIQRNNDNAGVDLFCVKKQPVTDKDVTLLDLGVKARMSKHYTVALGGGKTEKRGEYTHFWLAPRSSIWKSNIRQANSLGVIDRSYRGVLMGAVIANTDQPVEIQEGVRLFQVLAPDMGHISEVILRDLSDIDSTSRGDGGFGSTGQ